MSEYEDVKVTILTCPLCHKKMVKHIIKEGARYHVHSYYKSKFGGSIHCSNEDCEDNHGYGQCVPETDDPDYGLSFKSRMKKLFDK